MEDIREEHCMYVDEDSDDKKKIHALRWDVHIKEKEELIKKIFGVHSASKRGEHFLNLCEGSYHLGKRAIRSYWNTWV